ncbi:HAD family hydrolase [Paenibacillus donghaensis]|uniref:HAD family hydrolase n=1 Tax=Paenibacillus donghaensis TaxID=414771 RepID=UPI001883956D|nr:HAD family hydrolase [Paenibacillus donghaensis]MBE9918250.1 HAD family hydrolase [Paenibacillus donghaensis]
MYTTIIFDVDGTLLDTEQAVLGSLQKMLETDYNQKIDLEDLRFALGIPGANALPQLGITDIEQANDRWNYFLKDFMGRVKVFGGILDVMKTLDSKQITLGIVTSKTTEELRNDFVPFGLMGYLPHIVCADDTEKHKPNPEPLLKFIEISGADPQKALYIGDTLYDYECARDAGIDFALALWGCRNHEEIQARYKLAEPRDLMRLIQEI